MGVPDTFKAAVLPEAGAQHIITHRSLAPLEPGEVAVKITATAINPIDWKMRDYNIFITGYPAILGGDAAGEIAAVGSGVTNVEVGDRVFFQGIIGKNDFSTFQQYTKIPAELVSKTPQNISDEQASGIMLTTVAAVTALYDKSGSGIPAPWTEGGDQAGKGKAIVIIGGSSSIGQYAIQLAKISGFEKIVTNASSKHVDYLKALGADVVLDRVAQNSLDDFKAAVGGLPLAFVLDTISAKETQIQGVKLLAATKTENSHVVTVLPIEPEAAELGQSQQPKATVKEVVGIGSAPRLRYLSEPLAKHLGGEDGYIAKGRFVPNRPQIVGGGLAKIEEALARSKKGVSGEKIVILPFDG